MRDGTRMSGYVRLNANDSLSIHELSGGNGIDGMRKNGWNIWVWCSNLLGEWQERWCLGFGGISVGRSFCLTIVYIVTTVVMKEVCL